MAVGAEVGALDLFDAGPLEGQLGCPPEIEPPVNENLGAEGGLERLGDIRADLVAAGPDSRPDRGGQRLRPRARAPFSTIPSSSPRQPTWSTAAPAAPFRRAIATGRQSAVTSSIPWPGSSLHQPSPASCCVPRSRIPSGEAFRTSARCCCQAIRARVRIDLARLATGAPPVLDHALRIVTRERSRG